jgi:CheY-like chemotaxis protein
MDVPDSELILLVDDIPDHAPRYEKALADYGFRVIRARSGEEALRLASSALPRCAVIDLRLPDMSGWDVCRELKQQPRTQETRIIVLTPDVSKMCAADSANAGCHAWLAHPTIAEDLARTVKQVLELDTAEPASTDEALIGLRHCPACGEEKIRATLRVGQVQYYCCQACNFCWRAETITAKVLTDRC